MTILSALSSAKVKLVGRKATAIYSSTEEIDVQLADLANEVATDIMKSHDWRALTKIETLTGDGITAAFPLPADYDRMVLAQSLHDGHSWFWDYSAVNTLDEWIALTEGNFLAVYPGWWILLQDQLQFQPPPADGAVARYPYVSNLIVKSAPAQNTGVITYKSAFDNDGDSFVLDERLITLGTVWKYREQKGMGYAEDMAAYEMALSQEQARDKGARTIRRGRPVTPFNISPGWPWPITGGY